VDTILAVFLAAAISAGDAHQAANPSDRCQYYVSEAAQQVTYLCEGRPEADARQPAPQENPTIERWSGEQGSGAGARTIPKHNPTAAAPSRGN